jgi:hypothetical protein
LHCVTMIDAWRPFITWNSIGCPPDVLVFQLPGAI